MKALTFKLRLNSLYSIRIPFTWQSALAYPVPPPSAVIGLCANALQRMENENYPTYYLKKLENQILWAGSRLLSPCIMKSYLSSFITKFEAEIGGKSTNALSRQFAFSKNLECLVVFKESCDDAFLNTLKIALKSTPLTCGDSESPASLENEPILIDAYEVFDEEVTTSFPVPFVSPRNNETFQSDYEIVEGKGMLFLMHERCMKRDDNFPLRTFIVPIYEEKKILYPGKLTLKVKNMKILRLNEPEANCIIIENQSTSEL